MTLVATSIIAAGTIELSIPIVVAIEMSGTDWTPTIIGAAISGVIVVASGSVVTIIGALSTMNKKQDEIIKTTNATHTAANSTLAAANAAKDLMLMELKSKDKEIEGLKAQLQLMVEARTAAVAATTPAIVPPPVIP